MMLEAVFAVIFLAVFAWLVGRRSPLRLRIRLEILILALSVLVTGGYVVAKRFEGGLGAVTNMSDQFPWGIWIGFDLCGVALAAGGFVLAATVHVLHMRRFEPILKLAVLTSFIAYLLVASILVLDLGRPYRFWHPLIMWQPHSVMFEITLCLTFYALVLVLEFSPVILDRLGWGRVTALLHQVTLPVVMIGVIISTLHQSSFGSLFLIVPQKLHPLWYTPILPLLFLMSSVSAGMAVLIVESHLCATFLKVHLPQGLISALGRGCSRVLWAYLALRVADLWWRGSAHAIPITPWLGTLVLVELIVGVLIPAWWLARIPKEGARRGAVPAALLVIGGVVLHRLNVCWLGLLPSTGFVYVPSWMELVSTLAVVLAGIAAFIAVTRWLPVFPAPERET